MQIQWDRDRRWKSSGIRRKCQFNGMGSVVETQRDGEKECKSSGVGRDVKHT